jgi:hypothetical protein
MAPTSSALVQNRAKPVEANSLRWHRHVGPLALLVLAWLWFVGSLLIGPGHLYLIDTSLIDVPFRVTAGRMLREGQFPFWTSQSQCGFSLFADGQTGVLYPPFALYVLSPTPAMHDWFMALHYLGAGLAMYLFLLGRRLQPVAAALGGAIFLGSPVLLAAHVVPGIISTIAWLPLALWCIDRYAEGRTTALWWCAVVNCVLLMAGMPNTAIICFLIEAAYLAWTILPRGLAPLAQGAVVIFGVGAALAAVQLIPTYDYYRQSHRGEGLDWAAIITNCVSTPREIVTMGVCRAVDIPANWIGYALVSACGLTALLPGTPQRREAWFWLALAATGLALATGTPLLRLWYWLPVVSWFRWPMLYVLVTHVAVSVLVAMSADRWLQLIAKSTLPLRTMSRRVSTYLVCAALTLAVSWHTLGECQSPAGFYELGSPAIIDAARQHRDFRLLPLLHGAIEGREAPLDQRFWSLRRHLDSATVLAPNYSLLHNVPTVVLKNQIDAVTPRAFTELITTAPRLTAAFLRVAAVTHVSDIETITGPLSRAIDVRATDPAFFYAVRNPQPRAWLVGETLVLPNSADRLRHILASDFDCHRVAVVESPDEDLPTSPVGEDIASPTVAGEVSLTEPNPGNLVIEVHSPREAMLVVADRYAPEIAVTIDGHPAKLIRANHAFRGVRLTAGNHRVEMRYVPWAFWLGSAISVAAAIATVAALAIFRWRSSAARA